MVTPLRFAEDAWPCRCGRPFSPAQPLARHDAPFPKGRWRDAMSEGPFGRSSGRTKFAEPKNDTVMRFIRRWSSTRPSTSCAPLWCARSASKGAILLLQHPCHSFSRLHRIVQQHGNRHGSDSARHRTDPSGLLAHRFKIDVAA